MSRVGAEQMDKIKFIEKYLIDFDLELAADEANIPVDKAKLYLKDPDVKDIVDKEAAFRYRKLSVTKSKTMLHIAEKAYKEVLIDTGDELDMAARQQALDGVADKSALKALELLCKYDEASITKKKESEILENVLRIDTALEIAKRLQGIKG